MFQIISVLNLFFPDLILYKKFKTTSLTREILSILNVLSMRESTPIGSIPNRITMRLQDVLVITNHLDWPHARCMLTIGRLRRIFAWNALIVPWPTKIRMLRVRSNRVD